MTTNDTTALSPTTWADVKVGDVIYRTLRGTGRETVTDVTPLYSHTGSVRAYLVSVKGDRRNTVRRVNDLDRVYAVAN